MADMFTYAGGCKGLLVFEASNTYYPLSSATTTVLDGTQLPTGTYRVRASVRINSVTNVTSVDFGYYENGTYTAPTATVALSLTTLDQVVTFTFTPSSSLVYGGFCGRATYSDVPPQIFVNSVQITCEFTGTSITDAYGHIMTATRYINTTSLTYVGASQIFHYESSDYDGTPTFKLLAAGKVTNTKYACTIGLLKSANSDMSSSTEVASVSFTSTSLGTSSASVTMTDGYYYQIAVKTASDMYGVYFYSAAVNARWDETNALDYLTSTSGVYGYATDVQGSEINSVSDSSSHPFMGSAYVDLAKSDGGAELQLQLHIATTTTRQVSIVYDSGNTFLSGLTFTTTNTGTTHNEYSAWATAPATSWYIPSLTNTPTQASLTCSGMVLKSKTSTGTTYNEAQTLAATASVSATVTVTGAGSLSLPVTSAFASVSSGNLFSAVLYAASAGVSLSGILDVYASALMAVNAGYATSGGKLALSEVAFDALAGTGWDSLLSAVGDVVAAVSSSMNTSVQMDVATAFSLDATAAYQVGSLLDTFVALSVAASAGAVASGGVDQDGNVVFDSSAAFSSAGGSEFLSAVAIASIASVSLSGLRTMNEELALSGVAGYTVGGTMNVSADTALASTSSFSEAGAGALSLEQLLESLAVATFAGGFLADETIAFHATSSLTLDSVKAIADALSLPSSALLTLNALQTAVGNITLSATAVTTLVALIQAFPDVTFSVTGALTTDGEIASTTKEGAASFAATGATAFQSTAVLGVQLSQDAIAAAVANGTISTSTASVLSSIASLVTVGAVTKGSALALAATVVMNASASSGAVGALPVAASAALALNVVLASVGVAPMNAQALSLFSSLITGYSSLSLSTTASFTPYSTIAPRTVVHTFILRARKTAYSLRERLKSVIIKARKSQYLAR